MTREPVELSGPARRDLDEIRSWTVEHWGRQQWLSYYRGLSAAFLRIVADPGCGRPRDMLGKGIRSISYQRHLIFFAPIQSHGGRVVILRILHERRNLAAMAYLDDLGS